MENNQLELIIESNDEEDIGEIEESMPSIQVVRGRKARILDPVTILAILAGSVKLVEALISLQEKLKKRKKPLKVTVRNLKGETITLEGATPEQLKALVTQL